MRLFVLLFLITSANVIADGDGQQLAAARLDALRLERAVHDHPENALAQYQLGIAYRELGDNKSATLHLKAAIRAGFDNLGSKVNLIEAAFASKQSTLAFETAKQVVSPAVKSVDILLRVGRLLFDHLFYKEALRAFQLARQLAPDAFEPRFRLALTYYLLEDYAATLATLQPKGAVCVPSIPEQASLEASAEAKLGRFEAAITLLRAMIAKAPESPHGYINLALIELDRGSPVEAEAVLDQLRALHAPIGAKVFYRVSHNSCPEIVNAMERDVIPGPLSREKGEFYYQLAKQLQTGYNFLSAAEFIRLAQANKGSSARVLLVAGTSCLNLDPMASEGVTLLREAVSRDVGLYEGYYLLGTAYTHQGRREDAIKAYQKAAELHPAALYYLSLGKALPSRRSAVAEFQRALKLDSSYAPAHLELGRAYVELGELDKARLELEKAVELDPDSYDADYLLGRLLHRLGDEEQSRRILNLFAETKTVMMEQSGIAAGFVGGGN